MFVIFILAPTGLEYNHLAYSEQNYSWFQNI